MWEPGISPIRFVRLNAKRVIANAMLLTASLLVAGAIVEICLRIFPSVFPAVSVVHLKNHLHEGPSFRGESKQSLKILVLGDSFCTRNTSFPHLLPSMFHQPVDVYKICESGVGPDMYYQFYRLVGKEFDPDLIILSFYVGNDITNLIGWTESPIKEAIKQFLGEHFKTYHLVRHLYLTVRYRRFHPKQESKESSANSDVQHLPITRPEKNMVGTVNPFLMPEARSDRRIFEKNLFLLSSPIHNGWQVFEGLLQHFAKDIHGHSRLILLAIPDANQVNSRYHGFYESMGYAIDGTMLSSDLPQKRLEALARKYRIDFIDVLPDFRKKDHGDLYYLNDPHLNEYGQQYLAELVAGYLQKHGSIWRP